MNLQGKSVLSFTLLYRICTILFTYFLCLLFCKTTIADAKVLEDKEISSLFNDDIKKSLGINFPIFRVYEIVDKAGSSYIILTDPVYSQADNKLLMDTIKAYNIKKVNGTFNIIWQIKDFILAPKESSVWFWTKYSEFKDLNSDGYIDPVMIYGTLGDNGLDDGRLKILVYYKNVKYAIRHQNGILDFERNTQIDSTFYQLPKEIVNCIKSIMENIAGNKQSIFPYGWEKAMDDKKVYFDANPN